MKSKVWAKEVLSVRCVRRVADGSRQRGGEPRSTWAQTIRAPPLFLPNSKFLPRFWHLTHIVRLNYIAYV
eukprot:6182807-Pleurochrysis_carterae.AAC.4